MRVVEPRHEAEDVVQDVFLHALDHLDTLREPAHFRRWLSRIAVFRSRSHRRRQRAPRDVGETPAVTCASPEAHAELAWLGIALDHVGDEARTAFVLYVVMECSLQEVADAIGTSLATVKRRIRSAQDCLARHASGARARHAQRVMMPR